MFTLSNHRVPRPTVHCPQHTHILKLKLSRATHALLQNKLYHSPTHHFSTNMPLTHDFSTFHKQQSTSLIHSSSSSTSSSSHRSLGLGFRSVSSPSSAGSSSPSSSSLSSAFHQPQYHHFNPPVHFPNPSPIPSPDQMSPYTPHHHTSNNNNNMISHTPLHMQQQQHSSPHSQSLHNMRWSSISSYADLSDNTASGSVVKIGRAHV